MENFERKVQKTFVSNFLFLTDFIKFSTVFFPVAF